MWPLAVLPLIGLLVGAGAGYALRPSAPPADPGRVAACLPGGPDCDDAEGPETEAARPRPAGDAPIATAILEIDRPFVIPLLDEDRVRALIVASFAVEHDAALSGLEARLPPLRDRFIDVLVGHAAAGGFDHGRDQDASLRDLREALTRGARAVLGAGVHRVLITDLMRQDV